MKHRRMQRALTLLLAAALLALSGCASTQEQRRGTDGGKTSVILATSGEPFRFYALSDEGCAGDDNLVLSNVYDCLTFLEADGSISPSWLRAGSSPRTDCATPSTCARE